MIGMLLPPKSPEFAASAVPIASRTETADWYSTIVAGATPSTVLDIWLIAADSPNACAASEWMDNRARQSGRDMLMPLLFSPADISAPCGARGRGLQPAWGMPTACGSRARMCSCRPCKAAGREPTAADLPAERLGGENEPPELERSTSASEYKSCASSASVFREVKQALVASTWAAIRLA